MKLTPQKTYDTTIDAYAFEVRFTMHGKRVGIWHDDAYPRTVFEVWKGSIIDALMDLTDTRERSIRIAVSGKEEMKKGKTVDGQEFARTIVIVDTWRHLE
jgi:hypothetical protein